MKAAGQEFKDVKKISLFLSSPGDMEREREKVHFVVSQVNRMMGNDYNVVLEVIDWKTHVAPDMGRPQEVINRQIGDYDIFVGIMWKRFGTPTGLAESGTEEEFNIAYANWEQFRRPRIMFYFSQTPYMPKNSSEIVQFGKVIAFKEKIQQIGLCFEYQTGEEFADLLREHLIMLLKEWFKTVREGMLPIADFTRYLKYLKKDTMHIDVRGLVVGEGKAPQFRIDELYIPLKTSGVGLTEAKRTREERDLSREAISREAPLQEALEEPLLFIKGDPGSGKTTFLRLITFSLCLKWLGEDVQEMRTRILWPEPPPLPVFIRIGALTQFIREYMHRDPIHCPIQEDSPEWLLYFLEDQSRTYNWQVSREMFHREFTDGHCLILLDGLDEAPNQAVRERMSSLAAKLPKAFDKCHVVMTSRPAALSGPALPMGFNIVEIEPLDEPAMEAFLSRWSSALYEGVPEKSLHYKEELKRALTSRPEIRRMARNPVMLTALAVVHWNEHRLPEQRAELYESILTWLFRAREQREGRLKADLCRRLLQKLALAMFTHPEGRQRQAGLRWAAETLSSEFKESPGSSSVEAAEYFLRDEMIDSGIVVERNLRLEFWHLSFQEFLAAYEIGGHSDQEQVEMLFQNERLYSSEWREVVLLLAGVLYEQGLDKINNLIDSVIGKGPEQATRETLPLLAREVGLLGGMVRDLSPFDFKPSNPAYPGIVKGVMGIFDRETFRGIPVQVRIEAADALGSVGDPRLEDKSNLWVSIPGGSFWMGAQKVSRGARKYDERARDNESPVHCVELSLFSIGRYPVTVGQYLRFIDDGGYGKPDLWQAGGFGEFKHPGKWDAQLEYRSRPVVYVSWYEAAAYASWCGCRLPTEAEWERAAQDPGNEYRKYPWGSKEPDGETANFDKSNIGHVTPVGIFPEDCSPEGVIDMAGNVWEWCMDWFSEAYYVHCSKTGTVKDPKGPEKGDGRVVRGGSYYNFPVLLRCAYRYRYDPLDQDLNQGFRVVRGAQS